METLTITTFVQAGTDLAVGFAKGGAEYVAGIYGTGVIGQIIVLAPVAAVIGGLAFKLLRKLRRA